MENNKLGLNAAEVLDNIEACIEELTKASDTYLSPNPDRMVRKGYGTTKVYKISSVYSELSIFDWFNEYLSMSQLKQMRDFTKKAIELGFEGYVCFKVGAKYCAHGMWASTDESKDGYSPRTGDTLYHTFRSGENGWSAEIDGVWLHDKYPEHDSNFTLKEVKAELDAKSRKEA